MEKHTISSSLLADCEKPAAELINPEGKAPIVLICEHASNIIPTALNNLGLSPEDLQSHIAWDIGAYAMACQMSALLDAPLVVSRISRLVYDCNRAPESGAGIPSKSETVTIPGNQHLSQSEINDRVAEVYAPFHDLVSQAIHSTSQQHSHPTSPVIITLHSFTPVYFGEVRAVELGILHDTDDRLAHALMRAALDQTALQAAFNSPYDVSDNVMHTINKHAADQHLLNVMIEVKNDRLSNTTDINSMAASLSEIINSALTTIQPKV